MELVCEFGVLDLIAACLVECLAHLLAVANLILQTIVHCKGVLHGLFGRCGALVVGGQGHGCVAVGVVASQEFVAELILVDSIPALEVGGGGKLAIEVVILVVAEGVDDVIGILERTED